MTKAKTKEAESKPLTLEQINEEIIQLTDLAQAVNARCFFLRETLKLKK